MSDEESILEENILKILIATDIHLGFEESDPIRDQDTFDTFEEILQIGVEHEVDMILLGGDLFHHARPSPYALNKCLELLRKYCLGDKPIAIEYLSDPAQNLHSSNPIVNYEDPNLNVSIPVFSIHGNHDDPTGHKNVSAIDLIASSGLINYFGRWENYDQVNLEPILLRKGDTKLALYGLSHIKDERLGRLFLDRKFKMLVPEDADNWFHLLVWHQNRATRGVKNYIPDSLLPAFLDLVIWGHEHDCRIEPEVRINDVYISQPGSSVATSLSAGEAITKKVGVLKIHKKNFKMDEVVLKTVRPFVYEDLVLKSYEELADENSKNLPPSELTMEIIKNKIDTMIEKSKTLGRVGKASEKPLIRLNVKCRDEKQIIANTIRFGQAYCGKVANPDDIVKFGTIKDSIRQHKGKDTAKENLADKIVIANRVEDMVTQYFNDHDELKLLDVNALNEAVKKFVDTNDLEAPSLVVNQTKQEAMKYLEEHSPNDDEIDEVLKNFRKSQADKFTSIIDMLSNSAARSSVRANKDIVTVVLDSDEEVGDDDVSDKAGNSSKAGRQRGTPNRRNSGRARRPRGRASVKNTFF